MQELSLEDRRTVIALWCKIAWADGIVTEEERIYVKQLFHRVGRGTVSEAEIEQWLTQGAPETREHQLSEGAAHLFWSEASKLAAADGHADREEMGLIHRIMNRIFQSG